MNKDMKIIDFTLHLTPEPGDMSFTKELNTELFDTVDALGEVRQEMEKLHVANGNVMILDKTFLRGNPDPLISETRRAGMKITTLIDPREEDALDLVDQAALSGASGIKFHPYFLHLEDQDFPKAVDVAKRASERGLWVVVCCSYGTKHVYSVSGVRLVAALAQNGGVKTPVIGLHGGGKAIIELMSIAYDMPNLLLETSYSLPFWIGSSVETDFVFAMNKLGSGRWIYGSDHPFMPMEKSRNEIFSFFSKHGFSEPDIETIMIENAQKHLSFEI